MFEPCRFSRTHSSPMNPVERGHQTLSGRSDLNQSSLTSMATTEPRKALCTWRVCAFSVGRDLPVFMKEIMTGDMVVSHMGFGISKPGSILFSIQLCRRHFLLAHLMHMVAAHKGAHPKRSFSAPSPPPHIHHALRTMQFSTSSGQR